MGVDYSWVSRHRASPSLQPSSPPPLRPRPDHEVRRGRRHGGSLLPPYFASDHTTETLEGAGVDTNGPFPPLRQLSSQKKYQTLGIGKKSWGFRRAGSGCSHTPAPIPHCRGLGKVGSMTNPTPVSPTMSGIDDKRCVADWSILILISFFFWKSSCKPIPTLSGHEKLLQRFNENSIFFLQTLNPSQKKKWPDNAFISKTLVFQNTQILKTRRGVPPPPRAHTPPCPPPRVPPPDIRVRKGFLGPFFPLFSRQSRVTTGLSRKVKSPRVPLLLSCNTLCALADLRKWTKNWLTLLTWLRRYGF